MAIRVIRHGRDPGSPDPLRLKCTRCRSVLDFLPSDAIQRPDPRDGDYYEVKCPVCGHACTKAINLRQWA